MFDHVVLSDILGDSGTIDLSGLETLNSQPLLLNSKEDTIVDLTDYFFFKNEEKLDQYRL